MLSGSPHNFPTFIPKQTDNNIMADNFIAAIELGSSKVTAIAGCKQPDGAIQILAFAQEPSTTFIRKGRINNISKMTQCLTNMKDKLEKKLQKNISRVYVGIGGMGMHTVANTVVRHFDSKVEVTQEMVIRRNTAWAHSCKLTPWAFSPNRLRDTTSTLWPIPAYARKSATASALPT